MATAIGKLREGKAYRTKVIDASEWDVGKLTVRDIPGTAQLELAERYGEDVPMSSALDFYVDMVLLGVINDNGEAAFSEDDRESLKGNPRALLEFISNGVMEVSGLNSTARVDAEKNLTGVD